MRVANESEKIKTFFEEMELIADPHRTDRCFMRVDSLKKEEVDNDP